MGSVIKLIDKLKPEVLAANATRRIRNELGPDAADSMREQAVKRLREGQDINTVVRDLGITQEDIWDSDGMPTDFMDQCDTAMFHASLDELVTLGVDGVLMLLKRRWSDAKQFEDALRMHLGSLVKSTAETVEMFDLPEEDLPESFDAALTTGEHGDETPAA